MVNGVVQPGRFGAPTRRIVARQARLAETPRRTFGRGRVRVSAAQQQAIAQRRAAQSEQGRDLTELRTREAAIQADIQSIRDDINAARSGKGISPPDLRSRLSAISGRTAELNSIRASITQVERGADIDPTTEFKAAQTVGGAQETRRRLQLGGERAGERRVELQQTITKELGRVEAAKVIRTGEISVSQAQRLSPATRRALGVKIGEPTKEALPEGAIGTGASGGFLFPDPTGPGGTIEKFAVGTTAKGTLFEPIFREPTRAVVAPTPSVGQRISASLSRALEDLEDIPGRAIPTALEGFSTGLPFFIKDPTLIGRLEDIGEIGQEARFKQAQRVQSKVIGEDTAAFNLRVERFNELFGGRELSQQEFLIAQQRLREINIEGQSLRTRSGTLEFQLSEQERRRDQRSFTQQLTVGAVAGLITTAAFIPSTLVTAGAAFGGDPIAAASIVSLLPVTQQLTPELMQVQAEQTKAIADLALARPFEAIGFAVGGAAFPALGLKARALLREPIVTRIKGKPTISRAADAIFPEIEGVQAGKFRQFTETPAQFAVIDTRGAALRRLGAEVAEGAPPPISTIAGRVPKRFEQRVVRLRKQDVRFTIGEVTTQEGVFRGTTATRRRGAGVSLTEFSSLRGRQTRFDISNIKGLPRIEREALLRGLGRETRGAFPTEATFFRQSLEAESLLRVTRARGGALDLTFKAPGRRTRRFAGVAAVKELTEFKTPKFDLFQARTALAETTFPVFRPRRKAVSTIESLSFLIREGAETGRPSAFISRTTGRRRRPPTRAPTSISQAATTPVLTEQAKVSATRTSAALQSVEIAESIKITTKVRAAERQAFSRLRAKERARELITRPRDVAVGLTTLQAQASATLQQPKQIQREAVIQRERQISLQRNLQRSATRTITKVIPRTVPTTVTIPRTAPEPIPGPPTGPRRPRVSIPRVPRLIPRIRRGPEPRSIRRAAEFGVQVRRRGRFTTIAEGLTLRQAVARGRRRVSTTLARTFRIVPGGRLLPTAGIADLVGPGFRRPRKKGERALTFIERRERALSTPGEVREIARARLPA